MFWFKWFPVWQQLPVRISSLGSRVKIWRYHLLQYCWRKMKRGVAEEPCVPSPSSPHNSSDCCSPWLEKHGRDYWRQTHYHTRKHLHFVSDRNKAMRWHLISCLCSLGDWRAETSPGDKGGTMLTRNMTDTLARWLHIDWRKHLSENIHWATLGESLPISSCMEPNGWFTWGTEGARRGWAHLI